MSKQMTADEALEKAINYEADARIYENNNDFTAAAHSSRLANDFFSQALEIEAVS